MGHNKHQQGYGAASVPCTSGGCVKHHHNHFWDDFDNLQQAEDATTMWPTILSNRDENRNPHTLFIKILSAIFVIFQMAAM